MSGAGAHHGADRRGTRTHANSAPWRLSCTRFAREELRLRAGTCQACGCLTPDCQHGWATGQRPGAWGSGLGPRPAQFAAPTVSSCEAQTDGQADSVLENPSPLLVRLGLHRRPPGGAMVNPRLGRATCHRASLGF